MYQALLLDHYRFPRHKGKISEPHFSSHHYNPSCGDAVCFQGIIDAQDLLIQVSFSGEGCVISQAAASLLSEYVHGNTIQRVLALQTDDIIRLIGIELGPTRLKCALLPLEALQQGVLSHASTRIPKQPKNTNA